MRTLTKADKSYINNNFEKYLAYLIIDVVSKLGKPENKLTDDIEDAITAYHNALRANFGEK